MTTRIALLLSPLAVMAIAVSSCGEASSEAQVRLTPAATLAEAKANPIAVSPLPGTEDASPNTQISFLGPAGTKVTGVSVVGSRSGAHAGKLEPYSTGTGESFLVDEPFKPGEQVAVHALVGVGTPNQPVTTTFTVAHQASVSQLPFPLSHGDAGARQRYATLPGLAPSTVKITTPARPGAAPGYLFLAPYQGAGTPGPMIAAQDGTLVWFHPLPKGWDATNFQVQRYEGKPVLTWWQGKIVRVGFGEGEDVIYDSSYRQIARVRAGNGYRADLHEIRLTPQGTAWIDEFDPIHMSLRSVHGSSKGILTDSVVQQIDVKTGLVMWEWHALGHIALKDSYNGVPKTPYPWDYVHVNSVEEGSTGDVLLSARNTWALYDVDLRTGAFRWQLGGPHSSFKLGPGAKTYWQHDAELQPDGTISVFDNGSTPPKERQSRGVILKPSLSSHTVALERALTNPRFTLRADAQGNLAALAGGDWLMGYGNLPNFTEYDSSGHVLLDGTLARGVQDFRTYLSPWSGHPAAPPAILAKHAGGAVVVKTSWNGATDVASWQLLAGASPSSLSPVATVAKGGFETTLQAPAGSAYVATRALSGAGEALATSPAVRPS
jgi:Arylsulfotransferase (ASST)